MKRAVLLLAPMIVACSAVVKPVATPDGKKGFSVSCDGSADDWGTCYNAAAKACGGKYDIIDTNHSSTPTGLGPLVNRSLIVSCKA